MEPVQYLFSEEIATLTDLTTTALQYALARLTKAVDISKLTEDQRAEAIKLLANEVTVEISRIIEAGWPGSTVKK